MYAYCMTSIRNYHEKYRKYGFPIITLGNTSSIYFVDEFYKAVTQFKYATSNTPGTQSYFCIEMGMPYFLFGESPTLLIHNTSSGIQKGIYKANDEIEQEITDLEYEIFRPMNDAVSIEQKIFVEYFLGLGSKISRFRMSYIIWLEFLKKTYKIPKLLVQNSLTKIFKVR